MFFAIEQVLPVRGRHRCEQIAHGHGGGRSIIRPLPLLKTYARDDEAEVMCYKSSVPFDNELHEPLETIMLIQLLLTSLAHAATPLDMSWATEVTDVTAEPCSGDFECTKMAEKVLGKIKARAREQARSYCVDEAPSQFGGTRGEFKGFLVADVTPYGGAFMVTGQISCVVYES